MRLSIPVLFCAFAVSLSAVVPAPSVGREASGMYAQLCSGCHGEKLEGGKAPTLLGPTFRHGGDDASLLRSILEGYPASEMPAFKATVSAPEARALITFIHETRIHSRDPQPSKSEALPTGVQHSEKHSYRLESIAEGLDVPWSIAFLPDDRILVTERVGRLRVIDHGKLLPDAIAGIPKVVVRDEAGLMSVVAHPDFAHNGWVYLSFVDPGEGEKAMTKIVRGRIREGKWVDEETIYSIPRDQYPEGYSLFGCRLVFSGEYLYFSVGERGITGDAQKLDRSNGKIHRIFADGKIPPDNPYVRESGAFASVYAIGVRNPQGLAIDPRDGALWESEHGPRGGDELNWIRAGRNYGWPVITYGMNYDGTAITDKTEAPGMEQPVLHWTPSIATSEIEFYRGERFPQWKGNLFLGSLAQQKLLRIEIGPDHQAAHVEEIFKHLGRIRDIKTGPDGLLYLALELVGQPGRIARFVPAD
ncbi:MAG TPA: PQQ-dependent sugar dehydrogenase [Candidatus Didemnitutus sp.]|nr:PQQ-dependent sugar dehydrogenase [Candidatus Didemnitutus sp.]